MKIVFSLALTLFSCSLIAQISFGGEPYDWNRKDIPSNVQVYETPLLDVSSLAAEDAVTDLYKEAPFRFGVEVAADLNLTNSGLWFQTETMAIWQLGVRCPEATSISFTFDVFDIPQGARLFIWNADRSSFLGGFTSENMNAEKTFAVGILPGSEVYLEYQVPSKSKTIGEINVGQIVHGYREILVSHFDPERGPFGNSGACNINVNCPEGADWQIEKRSVALIVQGGSAICSGALVNNTAQDGTPYFLTANHCLGGSVANWVFYFNHEAATCSGSNGPTNQSISGAVLRASNAASDFALLELNSTPPASWNPHYAGWDHSDSESAVTGAVGIHHPSGDVKKICFEEDAPYHDAAAGAQVWWVDQWEDGVTEGGSSGSPLFNQDHRIIGQLYGGASACNGSVNNGQFDYYGRFGVSWDLGTTNSTRLRNWLDPLNSGVATLNGYPDGFVAPALDAGATSVSGIAANNCGVLQGQPTFVLRNFGTSTLNSVNISVSYNGATSVNVPWSGNLASGAQTTVNLPLMTFVNGTNTVNVTVSAPNGGTDETASNNNTSFSFYAVTENATNVTIEINLDNYPDESSWSLSDGNTEIATGGPWGDGDELANIVTDVCLSAGCYDFVMFDSWGDGMCYNGVCGDYTVTSSDGQVLATGGDGFDFEEATQICVEAVVSIIEQDQNNFKVFPNPSNGMIRIETLVEKGRVEIFDSLGKIVLSQNLNGSSWLNLDSLTDGLYSIRLMGDHSIQTQQILLKK